MNRTELDLRRALHEPARPDTVDRLTQLIHDLADTADHPPLIETGLPTHPQDGPAHKPGRRKSPRRAIAPILIAAAVAAIAATTTAAIADRGPTNRRAAGGTTSHTTATGTPQQLHPVWLVSNATVPGYRVTRNDYIRLGQGPNVEQGGLIRSTTNARDSGVFTLEPPTQRGYPAFVARTAGGTRVTVAGRPAYFVPGKHINPGRLNPATYADPRQAAANSSLDQPTLAVQHANGRWTLINGTFGFNAKTYSYNNDSALATMTRIDTALRVGDPQPVTVPFRLTSLPNSVTPEATSLLDDIPCLGYGTSAGPYPGEYTGSVMSVCRVRTGSDRAQTLRPTRINEKQAGAVILKPLQDGTTLVVEVDGGHLNEVSGAQAQQQADHADVTPTTNEPSTWLPVN